MKTKFFFLAVAAVALASCSNDETVEVNQGEAISFRALTTNLTRAADETFSNANDQFGVTAFKKSQTTGAYFDDVVFKTTDGSTFVSQSNKYYWPSSTNLDFYAYAPLPTEVGGSGSAAVTRGGYNTFTVTPGTDVPNQPDFVYAVTRNWGKATSDQTTGHVIPTATGVTINFRHAESKVLIQLKNTNNNLIFTVGNVEIGNLKGSGTFTWNGVTDGSSETSAASATTDGRYDGTGTLTYLNGTWNSLSGTGTYTVAMGTDDIDAVATGDQPRNVFSGLVNDGRDLTNTAANHEMILIPQELSIATKYSTDGSGATFAGAYITVQIKIQNKATDDYIVGDADNYVTAMWPLTALTWLPGHKYTYTIDLAGGGYYTTNQDAGEDALDPILEGAEIKFVTVTVDDWKDAAGGVYTGTTPSTPVVP